MKNLFFCMLSFSIVSATTLTATAQPGKSNNKKEQEIVIRKQGDKDARVTIEMKDDEVLINGKPLSEFNDSNITVMQGDEIMRHGNNMFLRHPGGNSFYFSDDNDKEETRPFLGVNSQKNSNGAEITDVAKGSAAEKAGLKEGDIITKVDNKKIATPEDLMGAVRSYKPKDEVRIYYQRNGKSNDTKATLGERKVRAGAFSFNGDGMDEKMFKDFKFEMPPAPPMPKQPFYNFWMPQNKKLGVKIEDTESDGGAKITNVEEGSVAEKAGLKKDDIITEIAGEKVKDAEDVRDKVLENEKPEYTIRAKRGSSEMTFEIKIPKKMNSVNL